MRLHFRTLALLLLPATLALGSTETLSELKAKADEALEKAKSVEHTVVFRYVGTPILWNDKRDIRWEDRAHFFGIAARLMRQILVDHARKRRAGKRGMLARADRSVSKLADPSSGPDLDVLALHDALTTLSAVDPRKSKVVELRFFGGLSVEETAEVLKVCPDTVLRDWRLAKAWLGRELGAEEARAC